MTASRRIWAFERGTLWARDLTGEAIAPTLPRVQAVFREVRRESAATLATAMGLPQAEPVLRRLASGRRCFAACVAHRIVAYGWVSQAAECIGELEREIQLPAGEAYIWDCVTLPPHRRQRLYSSLLTHVIAQLRREGVRRAWIGSSLGNGASIRGFANAGFRPVVVLICARLLKLSCLWTLGHRTAPDHLVHAARGSLTTDRENRWGPVAVGRSVSTQYLGCAQTEG